jgi:hypothetical protein
MNGSKPADHDDETKTATGKNKSTPPAPQTNNKTDPTLKPKNLFTTENKKAPALTNQSDLTKIIINRQLKIVRVADEAGTIDGMSTDKPKPGHDEEANSEIDPDDASQTDSDADTFKSSDTVDKQLRKILLDSGSSLGSDNSSSVSTLPGSHNKCTGTKKSHTPLDDPNQVPDTTGKITKITTENITTAPTPETKTAQDSLKPEDPDDMKGLDSDKESSNSTDSSSSTSTTPGNEAQQNTTTNKTRKKSVSIAANVNVTNKIDKVDDKGMDTDGPTLPAAIKTTPNIDCRYSLIIMVLPSAKPWPKFVEILRKTLKFLQDNTSKSLWITNWDNEQEEKIIKTPKDFPEGKAINRKLFSHYFSGYPNPNKDKTSKVFLKVRFLTDNLSKIPIPLLDTIGVELWEGLLEETPTQLVKNPYACQAVKVETIGWLFGSTKASDSKLFIKNTRKQLKIPPHVAICVQWRTIKDENKKNHPWSPDVQAPQALHLDTDHNYAAQHTVTPSAKLWRKGSKRRVNGLQL